MKAVLDTNVVISGVLVAGSTPDRIVRMGRAGDFEIIASLPLLAELEDVLLRPRMLTRLGWTEDEAVSFLHNFTDAATLVEPDQEIAKISDPADNRLLEAAVVGEADYVVSGDAAVLAIGEFEGVTMISPARFLAVLQTEGL